MREIENVSPRPYAKWKNNSSDPCAKRKNNCLETPCAMIRHDYGNVSFEGAMSNPMVQELRAFMRSVVGARNPTMVSLYRELAQRPLPYHWANLALRLELNG